MDGDVSCLSKAPRHVAKVLGRAGVLVADCHCGIASISVRAHDVRPNLSAVRVKHDVGGNHPRVVFGNAEWALWLA